ncbi:glycosyltransferase [Ekhidna sp.]|uniref:glycosyltransferase n=1 Tax=Ekhidna sp. TaxID=2608089 RepID=UPI00329680A2
MQKTIKSILLVSPEPWSHLFVSKHHYAIFLAKKGYRVHFLNPPTSSGYKISNTEYENLRVLDYSGFLKGLHLLPSKIRKKQQRNVFKRLEKLAGVSFDIIWSFDNSVFYDFDALPVAIRISHIVDLNQHFQTSRAAKSADFCFGVTSEIVELLSQFNSRTYKIGHGLSVPEKALSQVTLPGDGIVKALYAGNLAMKHLDWKILLEASRKNKRTDFVFIGSGKDVFDDYNETHVWKREIIKEPNVFFLQPVSSGEIHSYLRDADVLLVAYQQKHHRDQTNSHKILEYLYSGNPIVATYTAVYEGKDLLNMVEENSNWPDLFEKIIQNLNEYQDSELRRKRISYALNNTYKARVDEIEKIIFQD